MSPTSIAPDIDVLVKEKLAPLRERIIDTFVEKHPHIFSAVNGMLGVHQDNQVGMQVTEGGRVVGEYTFHLKGVRIADIESGKLNSEIHHPFLGVLKPYASIERKALENMIADENDFHHDLIGAARKYLPDVTLKFLH